MKTHVFEGIAGEWYRQRLCQLYVKKPKCPLLFAFNHLLGTCPTCGLGKLATSKTVQIKPVIANRMYLLRVTKPDDAASLLFASKVWPTLQTNIEYPLPIISYHSTKHIPMFIDLSSKTVLDFMKPGAYSLRLMKYVAAELAPLGFKYVGYVGTSEVYRNAEADSKYLALAKILQDTLGSVKGAPF